MRGPEGLQSFLSDMDGRWDAVYDLATGQRREFSLQAESLERAFESLATLDPNLARAFYDAVPPQVQHRYLDSLWRGFSENCRANGVEPPTRYQTLADEVADRSSELVDALRHAPDISRAQLESVILGEIRSGEAYAACQRVDAALLKLDKLDPVEAYRVLESTLTARQREAFGFWREDGSVLNVIATNARMEIVAQRIDHLRESVAADAAGAALDSLANVDAVAAHKIAITEFTATQRDRYAGPIQRAANMADRVRCGGEQNPLEYIQRDIARQVHLRDQEASGRPL